MMQKSSLQSAETSQSSVGDGLGVATARSKEMSDMSGARKLAIDARLEERQK